MPTEKQVESQTIPIADLDFALIPKLVAQAPTDTKVGASGKVNYLIIERKLPMDKVGTIRVFVTGERANGWVDYDLKGKKLKAG
jgi:hypothetical protein